MRDNRGGLFGRHIGAALRYRDDRRGAAVVEFAMLAPVLFLLLIGTFQFGILINQYIQVTEATRVGGRTLAISRGSTTPIASTKNAVYASAPGLTQGSITVSIGVGPSSNCNGNTLETTCAGYLTSNQGNQGTVTVSYNACGAFVFGKEYMPNCNLSSTTSMRIE